MTDSLFIDTDCISAFLWVGIENILVSIYGGRIIIPQQVYDELANPRVLHLKQKTDTLIDSGEARIEKLISGTEEATLYMNLTSNPEPCFRVIGRGEASAIALAKKYDGILASNNIRDITPYIIRYGLKHTTTADILVEVLQRGLITQTQGDIIWTNMLRRKRKLPASSFTDYLNRK